MLIVNSFRLEASEKPDAPTNAFQLRDLNGQLINFDEVRMKHEAHSRPTYAGGPTMG
jgi:hypothetical protein